MPARAKGSTDIHGNLQIYSAAIISINAERQRRGEGRGQWGVREFYIGSGAHLDGVDRGKRKVLR